MWPTEHVDESLKQQPLLQMLVHLLANGNASEKLEDDLLVEQLQFLLPLLHLTSSSYSNLQIAAQ